MYFFNSTSQASRQSELLCLGTTLQLQLSGATGTKKLLFSFTDSRWYF